MSSQVLTILLKVSKYFRLSMFLRLGSLQKTYNFSCL